MGKTVKLKRVTKPAPNSRSARKSALAAPSLLPSQSSPSPPPSSFLAPLHNAGVTKKKSQRPLKRKQRLRLNAGKQKAENVRGKIDYKVAESLGRAQRRKGRSARWEEVDEAIEKEVELVKREKQNGKGKKLKGNGGAQRGGEWEDTDDGDEPMHGLGQENDDGVKQAEARPNQMEKPGEQFEETP